MTTRKQYLDLTKLSVDDFQSRDRRNQVPLIYSKDRDYSVRDALLTMVSLQLAGAMGVSNDRACSIARNCDELLSGHHFEALRDPQINKPDQAIFIGRVVKGRADRLGTDASDTGIGEAGYFCGTLSELSASLASFEMVVNFQIVNLTNIAHELRRRCNASAVPYALLFEA